MLFPNIVLPFITFVFIYGWKITSAIDMIFLISCILISYDIFLLRSKINKSEMVIASILFLIVIYSFLITLLNSGNNTQFILRNVRAFINFMGAISLTHMYKINYKSKYILFMIKHIFYSVTVHSIIVLSMYQWDAFRSYIYALTSPWDIVNNNAPFLLGLRIPGLTYGLASTSVVQTMGIYLVPFLLKCSKNIKHQILIIFSSFLIIFSLFFIGNTGILIMLFLLPTLAFFKEHGSKKRAYKLNSFLRIIFFLSIIFGAFLLFKDTFFEFLPDYTINKSLEIKQFISNSGQTKTTETLNTMYHLPQNISTIIFGSSILGRGNPSMPPSDIGWVRLIEAGGIISMSLLIIPYFYGIYKAIKISTVDKYLSYAVIMILLSSLIFNFKEIGLYTRNAWSIQSILICIVLSFSRKEKRTNLLS